MKLSRYILFTVVLLIAAACASEQDTPPVVVVRTGAYVRVSIVMPVTSRANPTGGETGDGEEAGTYNENNIENLNLFFYRSAAGPGGPADTPIEHAVYIDGTLMHYADGSVSTTIQLDEYIPTDDVRLLVSANTGNLTELTTLGQVRDHIIDTPYRAGSNMTAHTAFTMANASAFDGQLQFSDEKGELDGSRSRPYGATVLIERTAARIDLWLDNSTTTLAQDRLNYVADNDARVSLENIAVINAMQKGTYMFKRVTESATDDDYSCFDTTRICGDEKMNASGLTLNYVVEPRTAAKDGLTADDTLADWYGNTRADYIEHNYTSVFDADNSMAAYLPYSFARNDGSGKRAVTLAYTNENTQHQSQHKAMYATGLVLRATYTPSVVYADAAAAEPLAGTSGATFYRYVPSLLRESTPVVLYFSDYDAALAYQEAHPEDNARIVEYPQGRCYYHLWIRHANVDERDDHLCLPMEYGIVRNNVYCLRLRFSGPGTPTPVLNDPENIKAEIYVRKWNLRQQTPIIM